MNLLLAGSLDDAERAAWLAALHEALPADTVVTDAGAVDRDSIEVALAANPPPGALAELPRLAFIQSLWAGVDRLLADPTVPPHIPIARMVDPAMTAAMVETAIWSVTGLHRGFFDCQRQQRERVWRPPATLHADEVAVAVLGAGVMGRACAAALASRGYPVATWSRTAPRQGWQALLARSRIVLNLLPLTPDTGGLLDADFFAGLPRGAAVVNLARGAHVVDRDLLAALDAGQLAHAVLDVFHTEPLPAEHPFWRHPAVTVLPHVAAPTDPRSAARVVAAQLQAWRDGRTPEHLVQRGRGY